MKNHWNCFQYKLRKWSASLNPNTSGVVGVSWVGKKWQASIMIKGVKKCKYFDAKEEAILQRKEWENYEK